MLCNNNSSRFGKFIDLQLNTKNGSLEAVKFDHFLLEKSRVVLQMPGERNFHIFYYLLKGLNPSEKFELELGNIEDYNILNQVNKYTFFCFYFLNLTLGNIKNLELKSTFR